MARCTICSSARVGEVDALLGAGSSVRLVARITGVPRATLARHKAHSEPLGTKFAILEGGNRREGGPDGPGDPLVEAFALAERARTHRERLRGLEQVRAAVKLKLRGVSDPDSEDRALLDRNIAQAEAAYRDASDFETQARALSGWREALHRRLDALRRPEEVEVPLVVTHSGSEPSGDPAMMKMRLDDYYRGVPRRFRDPDRYTVDRLLKLAFGKTTADEEVKVYERATGALAWVTDRAKGAERG